MKKKKEKQENNPNALSDSIIGFGFFIGVALMLISLPLAIACFEHIPGATPMMFAGCLVGGYIVFLISAFISMMVYSDQPVLKHRNQEHS